MPVFRPSAFSRHVLWLVLTFGVSVTVFVLYAASEKRIDRANEQRQLSFELCQELRGSSDDLTRMVRTYVVNGNPLYKHHYQEILDIRNGVEDRPVEYEDIYWDLVLEDDVRPHPPSGNKVALLELMRRAGFTKQEFTRLETAKANSDALTKIEFEAMRLSELGGPDAEAQRRRAALMLYSPDYHHAKADIMRPIQAVYDSVESRTLAAVHAAEKRALQMLMLMIALIVILMIVMWRTYRALRDTLGGSVEEVRYRIERIAAGDLTHDTSGAVPKQNTVAAWLLAMQPFVSPELP